MLADIDLEDFVSESQEVTFRNVTVLPFTILPTTKSITVSSSHIVCPLGSASCDVAGLKVQLDSFRVIAAATEAKPVH